MKPAIAVFGSINMDIAVPVAALPRPGETVLGGDARLSLGGKGANQGVAASRLGASVMMIGCVGADVFGAAARTALVQEGIDLAHVTTQADVATGVALITVDARGQNCISVSPGANMLLSAADAESAVDSIRRSAVLLVQNEVSALASLCAARIARAAGVLVIADPAPALGYDLALLAEVDFLTPNETEAQQLTSITVQDQASAMAAAHHLVMRGARNVLIKLGAQGVVYCGAAGEGHVLAPRVQAIDTVAAGDCFNGALAVALAEGIGLPEALAFACRAAAIAVTRSGAARSMPFRHEMG